MENYESSVKSKACCRWFVLVLGLLAIVITPHETCAQGYYRSQKKLLLGLEGGVGIRTFKLRSDVKELDQLNVDEEGFNLGVIFGGNVVQSRARIGIYESSKTVYQKIDVFEVEGGLNFYPWQIKKSRKPNYFRPYLAATLERDKVSFFGSYELPKPPASSQPQGDPKTCPDHTNGGQPGDPSGDPDQTPEDQQGPLSDPDQPQPSSSEDKKLGQIALSRVNVGLGVMLHVPRQRVFMNLFAEAKYGLPLNQQPSGYGLARTEVSKPFIVNFGICLGIKN